MCVGSGCVFGAVVESVGVVMCALCVEESYEVVFVVVAFFPVS